MLSTIRKQNNGKKGFSLVEALIYASILIMIVFFTVESLIGLLKSHARANLSKSVEYSAQSAMDQIMGEIKNASAINSGASIFDTNPGVLSITNTRSTPSYTIVFSLLNGKIVYSKDSGASVALTASDVAAQSLSFSLASSTVSKAIKINLTITGTSSNYVKNINLEDFGVLRGSY